MSLSQAESIRLCREGDLSRIQALYKSISSSAFKDDTLERIILAAAENNRPEIVRFCLDQGAEVPDDVISEAYDFPEIAKLLITSGHMDVNHNFEMAGDLLINAVYSSELDHVKWLLTHGADPNTGHLMTDSFSALTAAALLNLHEHATLLISHGAAPSGRGATAAAAGNGHTKLLRYLLDQGADINEAGVRDFGDGRKAGEEGAPLHKAAARGDLEMAKMLVEMGARGDVKDRMGRTPLNRAREEGETEVAEYLEGVGKSCGGSEVAEGEEE